jgi:molybdate transport system substrate-binding protein
VKIRRSLLIPVVALALAACTSGTAATPSAAPSTAASVAPSTAAAFAGELQVYAAASLEAVLARVKAAYEAANPGITLTVSTDSSAALETKIEQGAPADVFLSADIANPQKVADRGLAAGVVTKFAGNLLTVIVPTANPAGIKRPSDLATGGVKIIACTEGVPIQKYTATLLANLARVSGYPADFAARVNANVVSREDNVGAIVTKVGLGEGDAGIVYVTDGKASDKVTSVAIPDGANVPATYGAVVVKASANQAAATAFLSWLEGTDGQAVLATFGFLPAS